MKSVVCYLAALNLAVHVVLVGQTRGPDEPRAERGTRTASISLYTVRVQLLGQAGNPLDEYFPFRFGFREIKIRDGDFESAARCGWHELHTVLGNGPERYEHHVPWEKHLAESAALVKRLAPVLRHHGSRVDIETHGDVTTFELVRLIEAVGDDIAGICLDTANVLCQAEDPLLAAERAAPFTHLTHTKDAITYFMDYGYQRQGKPPGQGALDWESILPVLGKHSPDLPLSIEDHKWLFDFPIFSETWIELHPDLTPYELARVVQLTWECQKKIDSGEWPRPHEYEAIPYLHQMEERISSGRDHLKALLAKLGLRS